MSGLLQELRYALRTTVRNPGTSAIVICTVAIGICAAATVFAVVDAFLLRPLPGVTRQKELVNLHAMAADGSSFHSVWLPTYRDQPPDQRRAAPGGRPCGSSEEEP